MLGQHLSQNGAKEAKGGLPRGKTTEIYGPPGVGKTAFGLSAAASALRAGHNVVWVDCGTPLVRKRLGDILHGAPQGDTQESSLTEKSGTGSEQLQSNLIHLTAPTLPHVLALFLHPMPNFPPPDTALIVLDSLSTAFDTAFHTRSSSKPHAQKTDVEKWASNRRFAVQGALAGALNAAAAVRDAAVLVTGQTATQVRSAQGALLVPALAGAEWDAGIANRVVLFRDWPPNDVVCLGQDRERWARLRYAGVLKVNGVGQGEDGLFATVVPFSVETDGLRELEVPGEKMAGGMSASPVRAKKRSFVEIADSDDEFDDYGWDEEDELAAEGLIVDESLLRAEKTAKG